MSLKDNFCTGYIKFNGRKIYSTGGTYTEVLHKMESSVRMRVRRGSLKADDIIVAHIQDGSGYFESCPEVLGNYLHKEMTASEFIQPYWINI